MTKMFGNLSTENLETATDTLGGGFEPVPSGVYDGTIELAYAGISSGGASSVTVHFKTDGREVRETIYISNKKGENFYADKQDAKKKHPLPGFTTINDLCLLAAGEPLAEQETEEKTVKIYNFDERKEIPTPVQCLTALHGKEISLAILREVVDKEKKDGSGVYQPTGETRNQNAIDKVFHSETGRTVNEYLQEVETPEFRDAWATKHTGKDRLKTKGVAASGAGQAGTGRPGGDSDNSAKKNIFGKK